MNKPKVSIIIPVYNVERYVKKCINSVLSQSYTDYEIILVDDGSTDASGEICDRFAEQYRQISVIHQSNMGLGGARNTGIAASKGDYLLFIDSDDTVNLRLVEKCIEKAEKYGCDIVLFDAVAVYPDGSQGDLYTFPLPAGAPLDNRQIKALAYVSGACNRMYKRELFTCHNILFPNKVWYEDLRTIPKMAPFVKSAYYENTEPLYYYLQRDGSIMHTPDFDRIIKERIDALLDVQEYYDRLEYSQNYHAELQFLWLYHGYFLPVREMVNTGKTFVTYADKLRQNLLKYCTAPTQNPYFSTLSKKERMLFRLIWNRKYNTVKALLMIYRLLKKVKNAK